MERGQRAAASGPAKGNGMACDDEAAWITGIVIDVAGGAVMI